MKVSTRIVNQLASVLLNRLLGLQTVDTRYRETWIHMPDGNRLYAHIHGPRGEGKYPGVIIVPGASSPGTAYDRGSEVTADDIASCGFTVLHYDPSGRGKSGGKEDFWGPVQQDELIHVIRALSKEPDVDPGNIGIFSFSIGIIIAMGALSRFPDSGISYLYDWEGPSNRFNITKNDSHKPLKRFPTSNLDFWRPREPCRFADAIGCGYFRYQARIDHMQGAEKGHAMELLNLATSGRAAWTRMNDNSPNCFVSANAPEQCHWVPAWKNHKGQMLKYLLEIQSGVGNCIKS